MKAVFIESQGGVEVLQYGDLPEPQIGLHDVKVRVGACALNRLDVYTRSGARGRRRELPEPFVLGIDIAGEVVEAGPEVANVVVGQRVVLYPPVPCEQCRFCKDGRQHLCQQRQMLGSTLNGGYAEYVVAPAINAFPIADSLTFEEAAALPTTFLPVWTILIETAGLRPWQTVLVPSASAGVGAAAIQVGKHAVGARVIATTSSSEKVRLAYEEGADHVIDYTQEDVAERVMEITNGEGVDAVVDHVGASFWPDGFASLAPGGYYGICGVTSGYKAELQMGIVFTKQVHIFGVSMGSRESMRQIASLANRGIIRGRVHRVFPLEEARQAHEMLEGSSFFGKVVVAP